MSLPAQAAQECPTPHLAIDNYLGAQALCYTLFSAPGDGACATVFGPPPPSSSQLHSSNPGDSSQKFHQEADQENSQGGSALWWRMKDQGPSLPPTILEVDESKL